MSPQNILNIDGLLKAYLPASRAICTISKLNSSAHWTFAIDGTACRYLVFPRTSKAKVSVALIEGRTMSPTNGVIDELIKVSTLSASPDFGRRYATYQDILAFEFGIMGVQLSPNTCPP